MRAQARKAGTLILAAGLASALVAVLLWLAGERGLPVQATGQDPVDSTPADANGPTGWCPGTVVQFIPEAGAVWDIPQCGVVITFPVRCFWNADGAVFTFTPQADLAFPPPLSSTPYFFELSGTYSNYPGGDGTVSLLHEIYIQLDYDPVNLGYVDESTLSLYQYSSIFGWGKLEGKIDKLENWVWVMTVRTGTFGLGGYAGQAFMPVLYRGTPTELLEEGETLSSEP
jgi:hypothetical protein